MLAKLEATVGADVANCMIDVLAVIAEDEIAEKRLGIVPNTPPRELITPAVAENPDVIADVADIVATKALDKPTRALCKTVMPETAPDKPLNEATADVANVLMAVPAAVKALGNWLILVLNVLNTVGRLCIATLAICADVAIKLNPTPDCCSPDPAVAIPELAIAANPTAVAVRVPTKSPRLRSTSIFTP